MRAGEGYGARLAIGRGRCQSIAIVDRSQPLAPSPVIAVDGPAASGKGTVARAIAAHFQLPHLDTGLLYRQVALSILRWGGDPANAFTAVRACDDLATTIDDPELRSEMVGERPGDRALAAGGGAVDGDDRRGD